MSSWTPNQLAFIREPGHCVAVAGPGSGKTTSLIAKIEELARRPGNRVVACTFTSDGAAEMATRLTKKLGAVPPNVAIGTWHSLALQHRKTHGLHKRTLSPGHQSRLLSRIVEARVAPDDVARALLAFETIKCSMDSVYSAVEHEWFHAYEAELDTLQAVDLYDVMRETAQLMKTGELPLFSASHLLVDECQDNDEVQFALADLHAARGVVTTMVGDDDQAVYEWRHARGFSGMSAFREAHNARLVTLGDNFRSRANIVTCADELIRHNSGFRIEKTLVARRGHGGAVNVLATSSWDAAATTMVEALEPLLTRVAEEGTVQFVVPTGSVTILARNNYMLNPVEQALSLASVKYIRRSGSMWSSEPANLLMTVLATLAADGAHGPDPRGLDVALHVGGLHEKIITRLNSHFRSRVADFFDPRASFDMLAGGAAAQAKKISVRLSEIRSKIEQRQYRSAIGSASAFVRQLYAENTLSNARNGKMLSTVTDALVKMKGPIVARLKAAQNAASEQTPEHAVVLQTFHGSKGQEFDNVFLLGVDEDILPGRGELRAERRLLYVACTRARNNLLITHSAGKASPFLEEFTPRSA